MRGSLSAVETGAALIRFEDDPLALFENMLYGEPVLTILSVCGRFTFGNLCDLLGVCPPPHVFPYLVSGATSNPPSCFSTIGVWALTNTSTISAKVTSHRNGAYLQVSWLGPIGPTALINAQHLVSVHLSSNLKNSKFGSQSPL